MCSDSTGHQHSLPVFEASADVFCFFFPTWPQPQSSLLFFCCVMNTVCGGTRTNQIQISLMHQMTHIWRFFFFPTFRPTWWILNGYRTAEDAKILTRCEGRDLQIIRLKQGRGFFLVLVSRASQRGWLSGRAGADVALVAVEEAVSYSDIRPCGCVT